MAGVRAGFFCVGFSGAGGSPKSSVGFSGEGGPKNRKKKIFGTLFCGQKCHFLAKVHVFGDFQKNGTPFKR